MSINDPKVGALREKFTEMSWRKYRSARYQFRFVMFLNRMEKFGRARLRFELHACRAEFALLSPIARAILGEVA